MNPDCHVLTWGIFSSFLFQSGLNTFFQANTTSSRNMSEKCRNMEQNYMDIIQNFLDKFKNYLGKAQNYFDMA